MTAAQRNDHYRVLNERFDDRAFQLVELGYKYQIIPAMNVAVFVRNRHGKVNTIAAGTVLNADSVVWSDTLLRAVTH